MAAPTTPPHSEASRNASDCSPLRVIIDSEPPEACESPESVFQISDVSPDQVTFVKKYNDGEYVLVQTYPSKVEENDSGNSENSQRSGIEMSVVTVKEDNAQLNFSIWGFDTEIRIDHIKLSVPNQEGGDFLDHSYKFSDLDENLQAAFYKYLAVRGVTSTGKIKPPKWWPET